MSDTRLTITLALCAFGLCLGIGLGHWLQAHGRHEERERFQQELIQSGHARWSAGEDGEPVFEMLPAGEVGE